jgi:hypothetical protein
MASSAYVEKYYQSLLKGETIDDLPQKHELPHNKKQDLTTFYAALLHQVSGELEVDSRHKTRLPLDVCSLIATFCPPFPLHIAAAMKPCRQCRVTDQICQSHKLCQRNCIVTARSRQPFSHLQFFKIRFLGNSVGIGLTLNPNGSSGIRFNDESCGFYLETKCFHFGKDEATGEERAIGIHDWFLKSRFQYTGNIIGLAVDYERNQILLKWPNRTEMLRFTLPEHFQNKLLFPLVQSWGGCELSLVYTPEEEEEDLIEKKDDAHGDLNSTTISLSESNTESRWYSGWISFCRSRGLHDTDDDSCRGLHEIFEKDIHDDQTCKAGPTRPKNLVAASAWPSDFVENMIIDELGPPGGILPSGRFARHRVSTARRVSISRSNFLVWNG